MILADALEDRGHPLAEFLRAGWRPGDGGIGGGYGYGGGYGGYGGWRTCRRAGLPGDSGEKTGGDGMTSRKYREFWVEVKRIVHGEVKVTMCCCAAPGASARGCAVVAGHRSRCRCFCHSDKLK